MPQPDPEPEQTELRDIAQLLPPMPLQVAPHLLRALGTALEKLGYTDVSLRQDMATICARPPAKWAKR